MNWLLNLRATGIHQCDPLFNGFAIATKGPYGVHVFVEDQDIQALVLQEIDNGCHVHLLTDFKEIIGQIV